MAKKDKKKEPEPAEEVPDEMLLATTELEPEPEEIQFTDTSYTSASFESLPPIEEPVKDKKKKGAKRKKSGVIADAAAKPSEIADQWSDELLAQEEEEKVVEEEPCTIKKKKGKKGKKAVEEIPNFEKASTLGGCERKEADPGA